jgi:hypothetical protein
VFLACLLLLGRTYRWVEDKALSPPFTAAAHLLTNTPPGCCFAISGWLRDRTLLVRVEFGIPVPPRETYDDLLGKTRGLLSACTVHWNLLTPAVLRLVEPELHFGMDLLRALKRGVLGLIRLCLNSVLRTNHCVNKLLLPFSSARSVMGIALFLTLILQLASGLFLASYYVPEPGLVIEFREEMFSDVWFSREVFYSHVWGVDVLFVLSYLHILKKVFDKNYILCEAEG